MKNTKNAIIITGVHLELTQALKDKVNEKMDKLFAHEAGIIRIRVELEYNAHRKMGHCRKNARSFFKTGPRSGQKLFNSPALATRRKPVLAIAFDKMTVQRRKVVIAETVFF